MMFHVERLDSGYLLIVTGTDSQYARLLRDEELRNHYDRAFLFWVAVLDLKFAALGLKKGRQEINDLSEQLRAMA